MASRNSQLSLAEETLRTEADHSSMLKYVKQSESYESLASNLTKEDGAAEMTRREASIWIDPYHDARPFGQGFAGGPTALDAVPDIPAYLGAQFNSSNEAGLSNVGDPFSSYIETEGPDGNPKYTCTEEECFSKIPAFTSLEKFREHELSHGSVPRPTSPPNKGASSYFATEFDLQPTTQPAWNGLVQSQLRTTSPTDFHLDKNTDETRLEHAAPSLPTATSDTNLDQLKLLKLFARYPVRRAVAVENGVQIDTYHCGVVRCKNPYAFKTERDVRKHQRVHIPEHELPCACGYEGCSKRFLYRAHLRRHQEEEHLGIQYQCSECEYRVSRYDNIFGKGRHFEKQHPGARKPTAEEAKRGMLLTSAPSGRSPAVSAVIHQGGVRQGHRDETGITSRSPPVVRTSAQLESDAAKLKRQSEELLQRAENEFTVRKEEGAVIAMRSTRELAVAHLYEAERRYTVMRGRSSILLMQSVQLKQEAYDRQQAEELQDQIVREGQEAAGPKLSSLGSVGDEMSMGDGMSTAVGLRLAVEGPIVATMQPPTTTDEGYCSNNKTEPFMEIRKDQGCDTGSICTDNQDIGEAISPKARQELSRRFASELVETLVIEDLTDDVFKLLPDILQDFSQMLSDKARFGVEKKASTFVRHHRENIARYAREQLTADVGRDASDVPTYDVSSWAAGISGAANEAAEIPDDIVNLPEEDVTLAEHDVEQAREFLFRSAHFSWLLGRITVASRTMSTGPQFGTFRDSLLSYLPRLVEPVEVEVDWNPVEFLSQQYAKGSSATIATVITYCGAGDMIEATSCEDYTHRMWPTYGPSTLSCVEEAVRTSIDLEADTEVFWDIPAVMLSVSAEAGKIVARVEGDLVAKTEILEILAWLGAACRASPHPDHAIYCSPLLFQGSENSRIGYKTTGLSDGMAACAQADVPNREWNTLPQAQYTYCWSQLVRNPAIVLGYPVSRRHNDEKGLEIDLGLMTHLAKAHRIITVDGLLMLKSFCSMFVAVAETGTSVSWHYLLGANHCPVSYSEARRYCKLLTPVKVGMLPHARHFVGLVQSATILAGTRNANYDIGFTGNNFASTGFAVKDLTLGISRIFAISAKLVAAHKDTRLALSKPQCFEMEIGYARSTRVLLYDTEEKRGWLVDGHDALLHLSCAYLSSSFAPPAENGLTADLVQQFRYRSVVNGRWQTSSEVLCNPDNLKIRVGHTYHLGGNASDQDSTYKSKASSGLRFEDIVLNNLEVLRDIVAHQEDTRKREDDQVDVKHPLMQQRIVGFGFADIVSLEQTLRPRFADLKYSGPGWTELAEQTGAIYILGCGFGDLLGTPSGCRKCTGVPSKYEFLTASARILRRTEVTNGISWNLPGTSSYPTSCRCTPLSHGIRCGVTLTDLHACRAPEKDRKVRHKGGAGVALDGLFVIGRENDMRSARRAMQYVSLRCSACDDFKIPEKVHELDVPRQQTALSSPKLSANDGILLGSSTTEDSGYATGISSSASNVPVHPLSEIPQEPKAVPLQSARTQAPLSGGYGHASSSSTQSGLLENIPSVYSDGSSLGPQSSGPGNTNGSRSPRLHRTMWFSPTYNSLDLRRQAPLERAAVAAWRTAQGHHRHIHCDGRREWSRAFERMARPDLDYV
ncbi:hypothetical protein LTR56_012037 [Elasticomyces elasticus]|nr:hypothetical protein LTR56_012037 [Elasticomyces elasticus]KAK3651787.1 hypothetical protein LTR22_011956 [Elasticomyces elasticus]KAK4930145.1 hypothetical protein LTR49_003178 [Elasticomyces elasticus]KAK5752482.1 hypothetical protein LTS12_017419 [Elasticomyces elasticus]